MVYLLCKFHYQWTHAHLIGIVTSRLVSGLLAILIMLLTLLLGVKVQFRRLLEVQTLSIMNRGTIAGPQGKLVFNQDNDQAIDGQTWQW